MQISQTVLEYVRVLAWPLVAILALIILGPGGVLLRFADSLAKSVSDFTRSLPELKSTAMTLRSEADNLAERTADTSRALSREFREIEERIDALTAGVADLMEDVKELLTETDRMRLAEGQLRLQQAVAGDRQVEGPRDEAGELDKEEVFRQMRAAWTGLSRSLRDRLGNPDDFDGRQIAEMAKRLTGEQWDRPLTSRDVELIRELQAEHKRYVRLQATKDSWLTNSIFETFQKGIEEAVRAVEGVRRNGQT